MEDVRDAAQDVEVGAAHERRVVDDGLRLDAESPQAALERYPSDPRKRVLLGFSQGGVMAYDLGLREPERFAGLVALSSWLPDPLAASVPRGGALEGLPTFVAHGTGDPMIPVAMGRESRDRLLALAVPTAYREYEMQHEIRPEALRELLRWLDEKALNPIQLVI